MSIWIAIKTILNGNQPYIWQLVNQPITDPNQNRSELLKYFDPVYTKQFHKKTKERANSRSTLEVDLSGDNIFLNAQKFVLSSHHLYIFEIMHTKLLKFGPRGYSVLVTIATLTSNNIFFQSLGSSCKIRNEKKFFSSGPP